jgi:hypothetical protein
MSKRGKSLPVLVAVLAPLAFFAAGRLRVHRNLGPVCDVKERFAAPGRPAYWRHCQCLGIRYYESPPPAPGSDSVRCFGVIRRSWTDTDEIALKMIEERERAARTGRSYESLPPELQDKVKAAYTALQRAAFRHDYPAMLEQSRFILLQVDDYGDTKSLEAGARETLGKSKAP